MNDDASIVDDSSEDKEIDADLKLSNIEQSHLSINKFRRQDSADNDLSLKSLSGIKLLIEIESSFYERLF